MDEAHFASSYSSVFVIFELLHMKMIQQIMNT